MTILYYPRIIFMLLFVIANTLVIGCLLYPLSLVKLLLPFKAIQRPLSRVFAWLAWIWNNNNLFVIRFLTFMKVDVECDAELSRRDWYFVTSNHQSWADILVLQMALNNRIPLLKFFLKSDLIKIPLLGIAWWALDFPFMKRHSKAEIEANPSLKGKDLETTQKTCEKFMDMPTSVMNFFEGTRFTPAKHDQQASPYQHLLKPKAGGTAFALSAMQGKLTTLLDVTLIYPEHGKTSLADFIGGRIKKITVIVQPRPIPEWAAQGDYQNDPAFRQRFQEWISQIWKEKDALLEQYY